MLMGSWVGEGFGSRAVLRLCALVGLLFVGALPMQARSHPAPIRKQSERKVVTVHETARHAVHRVSRQSEPESKPSHKGKAKQKAVPQKPLKSARGAKAAHKPAAKSKAHKLRPEEEADNDPLPLHRVKGAAAKPATRQKSAEATPTVPARKILSSNDFLRAAGLQPAEAEENFASPAPQAETFEHGESHPEDDERLPITRGATPVSSVAANGVTASVSAVPEPTAPTGRPSLPGKLEALAARAERAVKADAAVAKGALAKKDTSKPALLPVDKAEKDAVIEQAMTPALLPVMYKRNGHLIVPPPMKGTHEILVHQNFMADSAGLDRIQDDEDLDRMRAQHLLVAFPASASLEVNSGLPLNRRYARPWAARFATDIAKNFYARFQQPLRLNSAVRTVDYQVRLRRTNGNAAGIDGEDASPHLTGQAIDFGKRGMSIAEIAWMRAYLAPLMLAGKIDVEEEFQQACFHISIYRSYLPAVKTKTTPKLQVAQVREPKMLPEDE